MLILLIIAFLALSAFFSGMETAFYASSKLKIELTKKEGKGSSLRLNRFIEKPAYFISTTLTGNNIALVVFTTLMSTLLEPYIRNFPGFPIENEYGILLVQTLVTTLIIIVFGEFIPKSIARLYADRVIQWFAVPFNLFYFIFSPIVHILTGVSSFIIKTLMKGKDQDEKLAFGRADLQHFIESTNTKEEQEKGGEIDTEMFENALELQETQVRDCMVPRTEIVAVEKGEKIKNLREIFISTRHSRIIVYDDNVDNVLGYVHHFDLWKKPKSIKECMIKIPVIPEAASAKELLNTFLHEQKNLAWVVDEFGGTAGIVTMEDILEEIFGEIEDEHDKHDFIERKINDNEFIFSGRLEIDYLNEKYDLNLPEGEYETLAGLIIHVHEDIPELNAQISAGPFDFTIIATTNIRIDTVRLTIHRSLEKDK